MSQLIAVASGKGGVGKSFFSANIAMSLQNSGAKVLLVDADLGGANLHDFVGLRLPGKGIYEFLKESANVNDVIVKSPAGVDFVGGSGDVLGMAHITNFERIKIINRLKDLDYDYVLFDLGAGTSYNMIDFFNAADKKILVMNPEPTSLENAYGFVKIALYRKIEQSFRREHMLSEICKKLKSTSMQYPNVGLIKNDVAEVDTSFISKIDDITNNYKVGMVLNYVKLKKELNVFYGFENVASKYLSINIEKLGFIPYDNKVSDCVKSLAPFYNNNQDCDTSVCLDDIRAKIVAVL